MPVNLHVRGALAVNFFLVALQFCLSTLFTNLVRDSR